MDRVTDVFVIDDDLRGAGLLAAIVGADRTSALDPDVSVVRGRGEMSTSSEGHRSKMAVKPRQGFACDIPGRQRMAGVEGASVERPRRGR